MDVWSNGLHTSVGQAEDFIRSLIFLEKRKRQEAHAALKQRGKVTVMDGPEEESEMFALTIAVLSTKKVEYLLFCVPCIYIRLRTLLMPLTHSRFWFSKFHFNRISILIQFFLLLSVRYAM